jgi:hypothetical protein
LFHVNIIRAEALSLLFYQVRWLKPMAKNNGKTVNLSGILCRHIHVTDIKFYFDFGL